tara:strand:- start:357 stop:887 length:531 start_codon:yes stop_codon:yes gene_type:complete
MKAGFTIIEVLFAIFVLTVGAVGAFALTSQVISISSAPSSQLVASYLAQEGIEVVRNIRDSNLLAIHKGGSILWTDQLLKLSCEQTVGSDKYYEYEIDHASSSDLNCYSATLLKRDSLGYSYGASIDTIFTRKVTVDPDESDPNLLVITVEVFWQEESEIKSVTASNNLYNWFQPI